MTSGITQSTAQETPATGKQPVKRSRVLRPPEKEVSLAHGSGGKSMHQLVEGLILPALAYDPATVLDDQAVFEAGGTRLAFTTDSYVVFPLEFPGGDIGALAVNGTINDLAMGGAKPLCISLALIIEEGLPFSELERIVRSVRDAADAGGVRVLTGDTKVVQRGGADRLFINTAGIGLAPDGAPITAGAVRGGDEVLLSGCIGDHGIAIMSHREGFQFETKLESDTAPLWPLVESMLQSAPGAVHAMRDPTRGGLATTLNEIAACAGVGIAIEETTIPIREEVRGACEVLGLDPLHIANEGKLVAFVAPERAEEVLRVMRQHPLGQQAARIGSVVDDAACRVVMKTSFGGSRIVDMLSGDPIPRIC